MEYCLAVASIRSNVEVHAFCAMSNHVHAVVTDVDGRLPEFLHCFHRNVAVALNAVLQRTENFWAMGQTSAVELGDASDILERMAYVAANPTSAGLVRSPQKWPGVVTTRLCQTRVVRRPSGYFRASGAMPAAAELKFTLPKQLQTLGVQKASQLFFQALSQCVHSARARAIAEARPFLGAKAAIKVTPERTASRKERPRSRTPRFAVRDPIVRKKAMATWKAFRVAYGAALQEWKAGIRDVRFPEGTWMMARLHRVVCGPPT